MSFTYIVRKQQQKLNSSGPPCETGLALLLKTTCDKKSLPLAKIYNLNVLKSFSSSLQDQNLNCVKKTSTPTQEGDACYV